jgi:hypothetical protein
LRIDSDRITAKAGIHYRKATEEEKNDETGSVVIYKSVMFLLNAVCILQCRRAGRWHWVSHPKAEREQAQWPSDIRTEARDVMQPIHWGNRLRPSIRGWARRMAYPNNGWAKITPWRSQEHPKHNARIVQLTRLRPKCAREDDWQPRYVTAEHATRRPWSPQQASAPPRLCFTCALSGRQ